MCSYFYLKGKNRARGRKGGRQKETKIFHTLINSQNVCNEYAGPELNPDIPQGWQGLWPLNFHFLLSKLHICMTLKSVVELGLELTLTISPNVCP